MLVLVLFKAKITKEKNMTKYYTCYFKSLKIGKKILNDLFFVSLDGESWLEVNHKPDATIKDYKKIETLFKPKKNKDGSISEYMKIDICFLKYQAHYNNQKVEIKEVA
jgi:hypothetical protein